MWTRSAKQKDGTFAITVWDNDGAVYLEQSGFMTVRDAEQAAERTQREVLFGNPEYTMDQVFAEMSDDELLAELGM